MQEIAPGITMIDTLLAGRTGITAAYLVDGPRPALIDPGARTSAPEVRAALRRIGIGRDDLAWIVLTHVHLDHCGATGIMARAFPSATVVVHGRGAPHLSEPARLVAGTAAVHGHRWSLYGGLDRTEPDRIVVAPDGHRVDLGGGRVLRMLETSGHARHHMSVLDEATGTLFAGDAAGVRMAGAGLYPALPPPELDPVAGDTSLARLQALEARMLCLSHFGPVADPAADLDLARRQLALAAEASLGAHDREARAAALERALPLAATVAVPGAVDRWRMLGWHENSVDGLDRWADRETKARAARQ